ncbi:5397_t:CDS:2 [Entrophospora sp. SA101]|nr:5397_t:CDS:2 [Entrophospora sp. SA101]
MMSLTRDFRIQEDQLDNEYIFSSNCVRIHEKPKPFVETFGEGSRRFLKINPPAIINIKDKRKNSGYITAFDKFRKITNFANEDKKKYQLLDNALEEVYLKLTNEERNEKDDNDNVIKNPLKKHLQTYS